MGFPPMLLTVPLAGDLQADHAAYLTPQNLRVLGLGGLE